MTDKGERKKRSHKAVEARNMFSDVDGSGHGLRISFFAASTGTAEQAGLGDCVGRHKVPLSDEAQFLNM